MGKESLILLGLFYLTLFQLTASSHNMSIVDESSLLALKSHFINSPILSKNWSARASFCTWIGVGCSRRHRRVTSLDLSSMGLQGSIANEIGNLSFLSFLSIYNNSISGLIPDEIGNLRRLRVLDMARNQLSDQVPQSIGFLRKLKSLKLKSNYLSGDIPESIAACVELNKLDLSYNNLTGSIPLAFGNLSQLQSLKLRNNQLTGELSSRILNVSSLVYFSVGENHLSGTIPEHICTPSSKLKVLRLLDNEFEGDFPSGVISCHSLKRLTLWRNKFKGAIPPSIANVTSLVFLDIGENKFDGSIPPTVVNLTNLAWFDIQDNRFHGRIPFEMGYLSSLTVLRLDANELNGEVPLSIFNLSRLQSLGLGMNNLSSNLPYTIDKGLPKIEEIYLSDNQFHGNIPSTISNLSKLTLLELSGNSFTGHIPITLGNLHYLYRLNLAENDFSNNMSIHEQDFLSSLSTCTYLDDIQISFNPITGILPKSFFSPNLSASLQQFDAESCQIRSPLPNEIANLTKLIFLGLGSNELTGHIPTMLGSLRILQALTMRENKLWGSIPLAMCKLGNLYSINFAGNDLSGQLPSCFRQLSSLREVYFENNALNVTISSTLWFHEHVQKINLSNNLLHGSVPGEIGKMKGLIQLDLSTNQLSGGIPSPISQLEKLIILSLSNNKLDGPIPDSFSNLKDLQYLDLSHNHLSGPIPTSLEKLVNLKDFNVSFNELSGEIPTEGPFVNFSSEFFAGNEGLCGVPQYKVGACKRSKYAPLSKNRHLKYILPVIASVAVAAIILIIVLTFRRKRPPYSSSLDSHLTITHERISYYTILHATNNLDEENLIGRGSFSSVYKATFSDGMVAAVKVFNLDVQGAFKSFDTECQIFRTIRHRNLVKVITSCSNLDFKALVMAYMPNRNLEDWLYSATCSLNIPQRLRIMMDVASAVDYLHEGYIIPIVHCDLKPNNILLDEDMVAHVGDFGIAKLLTQEQRMQQTRTLGTIGYIAPEYGSEGLVSTMVDVYSYGILLMEVFSRRKPTDDMFTGELTMRRWVSESLPTSVMQIVDNVLLNMDDQMNRARCISFLTSIMEVALQCNADMPHERPKMKEVLARLRKIHTDLLSRRTRRMNESTLLST